MNPQGPVAAIRSIAAIVVILLISCAQEPTPEPPRPAINWHRPLEEVKLHAEQTGDFILMSFEASWCPWSRLLRESLYVEETVVESLRSFELALIDVDVDSLLCREFGVVIYPTIVVADAHGRELGRIVGYCDIDDFLKRLSSIRHREDVLAEMYRLEERSPDDPGFLISFGRLLLDLGIYDAALLRYERAGQSDQDGTEGFQQEAAYSMAECYMLRGEYKEAGRRFRLLSKSYPTSERCEESMVLAALCYHRAEYNKLARTILEDYLAGFPEGRYRQFVSAQVDSLNARQTQKR